MNDLTITGCTIRQDSAGRYCLNDLHKASGGTNHHRPSKWLVTQQAKALVAEIDRPSDDGSNLSRQTSSQSPSSGFGITPIDIKLEARIRASNSVRGHGITATYVVKELVYAYAMWISPAFHLRVIRAYDALVTGKLMQNENYWFSRRPHWRAVRTRVLAGMNYKAIATLLEISAGRVARAVRSMIRVGLLDPAKVAAVQRGPAKRSAKLQSVGWGMRQINLWPEVEA
jgi:hypothetical protein